VSSESLPDDAKPVRALGIFWLGITKKEALNVAIFNGFRLWDSTTYESIEYDPIEGGRVPAQNAISVVHPPEERTRKMPKEYFGIYQPCLIFEGGKLFMIFEKLYKSYTIDKDDVYIHKDMRRFARQYLNEYRAFHGGFGPIIENEVAILTKSRSIMVRTFPSISISIDTNVNLGTGVPFKAATILINIERIKHRDADDSQE
jgi:hypothetical protein